MNVLSVFDGMSCGQIALERAGVKVNNYFASEIDKHAIKVTQHNYPNTLQLGDVTKVTGEGLPPIDLLIGGSPCQGFSFAGKHLNFEDPRSKLFFEFVRLNNDLLPRYFFLENVKMKKEYQEVITELLGVAPIEVNSALVSAQNRVRYYWTNIPNFVMPEDRGILLKDLITPETVLDYSLEGFNHLVLKKSKPKHPAGSLRVEYIRDTLYSTPKNKGLTYCAGLIEGDTPSGISRQIDRVYCTEHKSPCLTKFDNLIKVVCPLSGELASLPVETYERLQTVPVNYTSPVDPKNAREMLGNGWTVDVIVEFFKNII